MEKLAETSEKDIRELIKIADMRERTVLVHADNVLPDNKKALVVVATGTRAQLLQKIMENMS